MHRSSRDCRSAFVVLSCLTTLALSSCAGGGIVLAVDLRTDLVPAVEFDEAVVTLDERAPLAVAIPLDGLERGRRRIFETEGVAPGRHRVEVELRLRGSRVVGRSFSIRIEGSTILVAVLTRDCRGVTCPAAGDTPGATECFGGTCVEPACGTPGARDCFSECEMDGDCASATACVTPTCIAGACLEGSEPTSCPAGQLCQPGEGCIEPPESPDAGPPVDGGGTCSPATCVAMPCGTAACVDGACVRSDLCGDGETCCDGACSLDCDDVPCAGQPAGTVCRAAAGPCDQEETCDGTEPTCPADAFATGGACRPAVDACDVSETCTGTSAACPANAFAPVGEPCSGGFCDGAGTCSDTCTPGASCPTGDACSIGTIACGTGVPVCGPPFRPAGAGVVCRPAAGMCDVAETCSGASTSCPSDAFSSGGVCRASTGLCDVAETCNGASAACPGDGFASAGMTCRPVSGACDVAESCSGASPSCPTDGFRGAGFVCRPDSGAPCDVAETCSGGSAACPADASHPLGGFGEACCAGSLDVCRAGECLGGSCASFGGVYALQGDALDICVPNPITGACTCPGGFVDQDLIDMDGNVDEGTGWMTVLHVCHAPGAVPGADFRGAYGEITGLPAGVGCGASCPDPNPSTGTCSCPVATADDDFDGVHYQGGTPMDCQRTWGMCRSLPTAPFTYGGTYRRMTDTLAACTAIPAGLQCEPNTITGGCSCPSGFTGVTLRTMMPHTDMVTYPNAFCRADMTVCVRAP